MPELAKSFPFVKHIKSNLTFALIILFLFLFRISNQLSSVQATFSKLLQFEAEKERLSRLKEEGALMSALSSSSNLSTTADAERADIKAPSSASAVVDRNWKFIDELST